MKYSIIINHISNDLYAIIMKSWELNEDNEQTNVVSMTKTGVTLKQALDLQADFIKQNGQ